MVGKFFQGVFVKIALVGYLDCRVAMLLAMTVGAIEGFIRNDGGCAIEGVSLKGGI